MIPRFFTYSVASMVFTRRHTESDDFKEFVIPSSPIKINSVLSGFSMSLLFPIHSWMALRQFANLVIHELKFQVLSKFGYHLHIDDV